MTFFFLESLYNRSNTDCLEKPLEIMVVSLWFLVIDDLSKVLFLMFMLVLALLKDSLMD